MARRVVRPVLLRRDDLLELRFEFINLELVTGGQDPPFLERQNDQLPAYVIITFPPQSIEEEAFFETAPPDEQSDAASEPTPDGTSPQQDPDAGAGSDPLRPPPVRALMSGLSRLVFTIPQTIETIPYTVAGLLDWTEWEPSLAPVALPPNPTSAELDPLPQIAEPNLRHTAIEFPYRMIISPNRFNAWVHAIEPVEHEGRVELWHTRLGIKRIEADEDAPPANERVHEDDDPNKTVRVIWSQDYNKANPPPELAPDPQFRAPMTANDRHQLVRLTSDFTFLSGHTSPGIGGIGGIDLDELTEIGNQPGIGNRPGNIVVGDGPIIGPVDDQPGIGDDIVIGPIPIPLLYRPVPVDAEQLMLTTQGAWAKFRGAWTDEDITPAVRATEDLTILSWRHVSTQARDHYVRIVYLGYAYPTRHAMAIVKVTERKFQEIPGTNTVVAYLRQRMFPVFRELVKDYTQNNLYQRGGREMPIKRIQMLTRIAPNIQPPENHQIGTTPAFWIHVAPDEPFQFDMAATDVLGSRISMRGGIIFVPVSQIDDSAVLETVRQAYAVKNPATAPKFSIPNQRVAYAPLFQKDGGGSHDGTTQLETEALYFTTRALNFPQQIPPWMPHLRLDNLDNTIPANSKVPAADVRVPAADQIAGGSQGTHPIFLYQRFLDAADNAGSIFAEMAQKKAVGLAAEQAGGLATPSVNMSGISQHLGPVAGTLNNIADGGFDPADFFDGVSAKLLGGIDLFDLIKLVALGDGATNADNFPDQFPKMQSLPKPSPSAPDRIETTLTWVPQLRVPMPAFLPLKTNNNTFLQLNVLYIQHLNDTPPAATISGTMTDFDINFAGIINIHFNNLAFNKTDNKKLDVDVDIPSDGITFEGPLKFLHVLQDYLSPEQFKDPPSLSISPTGVTVGFSLELPPLAIGVFTLQNVALGAALTIPFGDEAMRVRFNLSERHDPFRLAVMIFAGGGFFAVTLASGKMEVLEIMLEFGGSLSLDIGVASGGVSVMAGIYFKLENKTEMIDGKSVEVFSIQLTAYVRLNGYLSVLGIISLSIEFYLELTYKEISVGGESKNKLEGTATVTVEIEVLFFSASVSMTVKRRFSGDANDPTFSDQFSLAEWAAYGEAFA